MKTCSPFFRSIRAGTAAPWTAWRYRLGRHRWMMPAAALRAIELDENSAGAHEVLALVRTYIDWNWDGARERKP